MEIRIYFEGNRMLRTGFKRLFSELELIAHDRGSRIEFVAAKDGPSDYRKARRAHPDAWNILLKDSEQAMPKRPASLCKQHGIDAAFAENVFWMVQLMEAWFLADPDALTDYFGKKGFSANAIGKTADVESVPKAEVLDKLRRATNRTTKGEYDKVAHAPFLLERLNPESGPATRATLPKVIRRGEVKASTRHRLIAATRSGARPSGLPSWRGARVHN